MLFVRTEMITETPTVIGDHFKGFWRHFGIFQFLYGTLMGTITTPGAGNIGVAHKDKIPALNVIDSLRNVIKRFQQWPETFVNQNYICGLLE